MLVCRKAYWQDMDPTHFLDGAGREVVPQKDYHRIFIGEIVEATEKKLTPGLRHAARTV